MFIKKNSPIYLISLAIFLYVIFKGYNENVGKKANEAEFKAEESRISINTDSFTASFDIIADVVKQADAVIAEIETFYKVSYSNTVPQTRIGLCSNGYVFDIETFDEQGNAISQFKNINLSKFGYEKDFYNILNEALTLSALGQKIEIFFNLGNSLPKSVIGKKVFAEKESAISMITVKQITGKLIFNASKISLFSSEDKPEKRIPKPKFFCKTEVVFTYSIYDSKGKILKKDIPHTLTLGKGLKNRDFILEYLALKSRDGKIDAVVPAKDFTESKTAETVIIKGNIVKKNV